MSENKHTRIGLLTITGVLLIGLLIYLTNGMLSSSAENAPPNPPGDEEQASLVMAAEDLNNVLPQNVDAGTTFDSVGVGQGTMTYYYSLPELTGQDIAEQDLGDSLYTEALDRIPCTLWRPSYMQNVEVGFTYFSGDSEEVLAFTRTQVECQ